MLVRRRWIRTTVVLALLAPGALARSDEAAPGPWRVLVDWPAPSVVQDIQQMPDGHLLVATATGLQRFDGLTFSEIELPHTRSVRRILAARDGAVWVALGAAKIGRDGSAPGQITVGFREGSGGLVRVMGKHVHEVLPPDGKPEHWVWALAETPDHRILIGTEAGLFRTDAANGEAVQRLPLGVEPQPLVTGIAASASGGAFWAASSQGVFHSVGTTVSRVWQQPVTAFAAQSDNAFVIHDDDVWAVSPVPTERARALGLAAKGVAVLSSDGKGGVWAASGQAIFHARADGSRESIPLAGSVSPLSITVDREGSVWVGTEGLGLIQAKPTGVQSLWSGHGLSGDVAFSVMRARDNSMWVRTNEGLVAHDGRGFTLFRNGADFPAWAPGPMAQSPDGSLWIGAKTLLHGVWGRFVEARVATAGGTHARSLLVNRQGDLWVGWYRGGLTRYPGARVDVPGVELGNADGFCTGLVSSISEGPSGTIWATGRKGLWRFRDGQSRCFDANDGLPTIDLTGALEMPDGNVWLSGVGDVGLSLMVGGRVHGFDLRSGVPRGSFFAIVDDHEGGLWLTSDHGVFAVPVDALVRWTQGGPAVLPRRFGAHEGLRSEHAVAAFPPAAALAADGTLWVPTLGGLALVAPLARQPQPQARPVISTVLVDGRDQLGGAGPLLVEPGSHTLEFRFSAASFLAPRGLRFSHRLEGVDAGWSEPSGAREARYAHLGAGNYRFAIGLVDDAGRIDQTGAALVTFSIAPHLYQRRGFQIACVVLAGLLAFLLHRLRVKRIEARFAIVHAERVRIARELHDGLAQVFLGLGFQLDGLRIALGDEAPPQILTLAEGARELLDRAQAETRSAVWTLRAEAGDDVLRRSLARVAARSAKDLGVDVRVDVGAVVPPRSGVLEHELPAIVREAITNAVDHGRARVIRVSLTVAASGLVLSVLDDGKGFSATDESGGGFGLVGMRERARRVGGELNVGPGPEGGTLVTVRLPPSAVQAASTPRSSEQESR